MYKINYFISAKWKLRKEYGKELSHIMNESLTNTHNTMLCDKLIMPTRGPCHRTLVSQCLDPYSWALGLSLSGLGANWVKFKSISSNLVDLNSNSNFFFSNSSSSRFIFLAQVWVLTVGLELMSLTSFFSCSIVSRLIDFFFNLIFSVHIRIHTVLKHLHTVLLSCLESWVWDVICSAKNRVLKCYFQGSTTVLSCRQIVITNEHCIRQILS